jgi:transcriptional regulatory protein RtcR
LAPGGRISTQVVDEETSRLYAAWHKSDASPQVGELDPFLTLEQLKQIDAFDRAQLAFVVSVCKRSRSLSEAGRTLFGASRTRKSLANDADRLRKYLARFGLEFSRIHSTAHLPALANY